MSDNVLNGITHIPLIILGAGMAGLGAAIQAQRMGVESLVIEASNRVGGLCQNSVVEGCDFDFGPKILLLDDSEDAADILDFLEGNHQRYPVVEMVYLSEYGQVGFPLQRHLVDLPASERKKILQSLETARQHPVALRTYRDWLRNGYGEYLCQKVLYPYEEKKWQAELDTLDFEWANTRPVRVDLAEVKRGAETKLPPSKSYYYPKKGNIATLSNTMALHAGPILLSHPVEQIDLAAKRIVAGNRRFSFDSLVSTVPLDYAVSITKQMTANTRQASSRHLKRLGIRVFNVVFHGRHNLQGTAIYFAEKEFPFRRVSILENLCPALGRSDRTAISLEVSINRDEPAAEADTQLAHMLEKLMTIPQFAGLGAPMGYEMLEVDFAYPIQGNGLRPFVNELHAMYEKEAVYHCGRGGNFDYCNSDIAYTQGRNATIKAMASAITTGA